MVTEGAVALDTNVAILLTKGHWQTAQVLVRYEEVLLPVPVAGELLYGAYNSGRDINLVRDRQFIAGFKLLEVTAEVAEHYGAIRFSLKGIGQLIPENDMWIAAVCRAHSVPLFTLDKHFNRVAGLHIITE